MTLIRALPAEFDNFTSALLLQKDIDKAKVIDAFVTEESNCLHRSTQSAMLSNKHIPSFTLTWPSTKWCNFCDLSTHNTDVCYLLANAKKSNLERKQIAKFNMEHCKPVTTHLLTQVVVSPKISAHSLRMRE